MKHPEAEYISLGYRLEKASTTERSRAILAQIREKMEQEEIDERGEARYLIERGRREAREESND